MAQKSLFSGEIRRSRWQIYSGLGSASDGNTEIEIEKESISLCDLNPKGVESGLLL